MAHSRYLSFDRAEWARLRANTPLTLSESDLAALRGMNEHVSLVDVADIYLPLSRLLNLYVSAMQQLHQVSDTFLGNPPEAAQHVPYVIGIAGSVAVGKSTTARILQTLLARWSNHPRVDLVTTDGFLYPNAVLEARGLMSRKGYPESYDQRRLVQFIADIKSGRPAVEAPVYSHLSYDIVPNERNLVRQPDILILEGLNVLQTGDGRTNSRMRQFVSDFFDFSIYIDAAESEIEQWYVERFLALRDTVFQSPSSYFHRYATLTREEAVATSRRIWAEINGGNLRENILPTRERAHLILQKGPRHTIETVKLRKI